MIKYRANGLLWAQGGPASWFAYDEIKKELTGAIVYHGDDEMYSGLWSAIIHPVGGGVFSISRVERMSYAMEIVERAYRRKWSYFQWDIMLRMVSQFSYS